MNSEKEIYRWGPIPGRLLMVSHWAAIFYWYPRRLHYYYWPEGYVIFQKNNMLFVNEMNKLERIGEKVLKNIIIIDKQRDKFYRIWQELLNDLLDYCRQISESSLKKISDKNLIEQWKIFNKKIYDLWEVAIVPELGAYGGEYVLKKLLAKEKISASKKREALAALSATSRLSFYQEEEMDLLRLAKQYKNKKFNEKLLAHQQKYYWLQNSYYETKVITVNYFRQRVKKYAVNPDQTIKEIKRQQRKILQQRKRSLNWVKNKKEIKKVSDALADCIWWQDQRKKYIFKYLHYLDLLTKEITSRSGAPKDIFYYAWPEELSLSPTPALIKKLKKRANHPLVIHFYKGHRGTIVGQRVRNILKKFWQVRKVAYKKITGMTIYNSGTVIIGKVFVVRKPGDIVKFPSGSILVTGMTAPEYIMAIRKAKAIITDTGGLTCHAAIVARELGVPCIVGTRFATKIFKTGDLVEVDADKGSIKKI